MRAGPVCNSATTVLLSVVIACSGPSSAISIEDSEGIPSIKRIFEETLWDTIYSITSDPAGPVLVKPRVLAVHDATLYAWDYGDHQLKTFGPRGSPLWTFGRLGDDPGEFRNPTDLAVSPSGNLWIVDAPSARITILSRQGTIERFISLGDGLTPHQLVLLTEGYLTTPLFDQEDFWVAFDSTGVVRHEEPFPSDDLVHSSPYLRQSLVDNSQDHHLWAAVFFLGDSFVVYKGRSFHCRGRLAIGLPVSRELPEGTRGSVWAADMAVSDTSLFVLARSREEDDLKLLDEFSLSECRYLRSLHLPQKTRAFAYENGVFYMENEDPVPSIVALRRGNR